MRWSFTSHTEQRMRIISFRYRGVEPVLPLLAPQRRDSAHGEEPVSSVLIGLRTSIFDGRIAWPNLHVFATHGRRSTRPPWYP